MGVGAGPREQREKREEGRRGEQGVDRSSSGIGGGGRGQAWAMERRGFLALSQQTLTEVGASVR